MNLTKKQDVEEEKEPKIYRRKIKKIKKTKKETKRTKLRIMWLLQKILKRG